MLGRVKMKRPEEKCSRWYSRILDCSDPARFELAVAKTTKFSGFGGWSLALIFDDEERVEVASRSTENMAGSDVFAAERVIFDSGNEKCAIRVECSG